VALKSPACSSYFSNNCTPPVPFPHFNFDTSQAMESDTTNPRGHKGRWLDALFLCMILISIIGLTYSVIHQ
jgi:hypothetical protein